MYGGYGAGFAPVYEVAGEDLDVVEGEACLLGDLKEGEGGATGFDEDGEGGGDKGKGAGEVFEDLGGWGDVEEGEVLGDEGVAFGLFVAEGGGGCEGPRDRGR